jgi:hypothetical protein
MVRSLADQTHAKTGAQPVTDCTRIFDLNADRDHLPEPFRLCLHKWPLRRRGHEPSLVRLLAMANVDPHTVRGKQTTDLDAFVCVSVLPGLVAG